MLQQTTVTIKQHKLSFRNKQTSSITFQHLHQQTRRELDYVNGFDW